MIVIRTDEFFIPAGETLDLEVEREKLEKELIYLKGFLVSVRKKLENERFMANAKEDIILNERNKEADAMQKIKLIESQLKDL
jgi:valyl-tRNA synthetase